MPTNDFEHEKIYLEISKMLNIMSTNHNALMTTLNEQSSKQGLILDQVQKTNGRVTKLELKVADLEKSVEFISIVKRNKKLSALVFLGLIFAFQNIPFSEVISKAVKMIIPF